MPKTKGTERGIREPFSLRAGIDVPKLKGVNTESDAGAIDDVQFTVLLNCRSTGNYPKVRPGLAKYGTQLTGAVDGIWDTLDAGGDIGPALIGQGFPVASPALLGYYYDDAVGSVARTAPPMPAGAGSVRAGYSYYGVALFGADDGCVYVWQPVSLPGALAPGDGAAAPRKLIDTGITLDYVRCFMDQHGELYFSTTNAGATAKVYVLTGSSLSTGSGGDIAISGGALSVDDTVATAAYAVLGIFHGELWAGYSCAQGAELFLNGPNLIKRRTGVATWATPAMPAGVAKFNCFDIKEYKDALYFIGSRRSDDASREAFSIIKWDGAVLTEVHTFDLPGVGAPRGVALCVFGDTLVYLWDYAENESAPQNFHVFVGTFDGVTWTDEVCNISALIPSTTMRARGLIEYKGGNLAVSVDDDEVLGVPPDGGYLFMSQGSDLTAFDQVDQAVNLFGFRQQGGLVVV